LVITSGLQTLTASAYRYVFSILQTFAQAYSAGSTDGANCTNAGHRVSETAHFSVVCLNSHRKIKVISFFFFIKRSLKHLCFRFSVSWPVFLARFLHAFFRCMLLVYAPSWLAIVPGQVPSSL